MGSVLSFLPKIPVTSSAFADGGFAVLMLIVGGFIWGKADNKIGLGVMIFGAIWALLVFKYALGHT